MSWQTIEALQERKLNPWLRKNLITAEQYEMICNHCHDFGFYSALGYATRIKYQNNPTNKKYQYKFIRIAKKECKLFDYITKGGMSDRNCKRRRVWRNIYFTLDNRERLSILKDKYPDWDIYMIDHNKYIIGLRKLVI